jgi:hypothetical protein
VRLPMAQEEATRPGPSTAKIRRHIPPLSAPEAAQSREIVSTAFTAFAITPTARHGANLQSATCRFS